MVAVRVIGVIRYLPTANGSESQAESKQIHIAVSRDGRFAINGKVTDRSQLSNSLNALNKDNAIQVNIQLRVLSQKLHQLLLIGGQ